MIKGNNSTATYTIKLAAIFLGISLPLSAGVLTVLHTSFNKESSAVSEDALAGKVSVEGHPIGTEVVKEFNDTLWFGLVYAYEVNGQEFTKVNEDDLYPDVPPAWIPEERINIWYDPENPSDAVFSEIEPQ